jgi:hypothetical protein
LTILAAIERQRDGDRDRRTAFLGRFTLRALLLLAVGELAILALAGMTIVVSGNSG